MAIVADILLLVALLASVGVAYGLLNPPRGPDRAMYGWIFLFLQTPRWLCITTALMLCVARGSLRWPDDRGAQYTLVLLGQLVLGGGCLLATLTAVPDLGRPDWKTRALLLAPFVVPALQAIFIARTMHGTSRSAAIDAGWIASAICVALFLAAGTAAYAIAEAEAARQRRDDSAAREAARATQFAIEEAAFGALTPADSLASWLAYTTYDTPAAREATAVAAIARRPNLAAELAAELAGQWTIASVDREGRALALIDKVPPEAAAGLAGPFRDYFRRLLAHLDAIAAEPDADARRDLFAYADVRATALVAAARGLRRAGVDVRPELTAIVDVARTHDVEGARNIVRIYDHSLREFASEDGR